MFNTKIFSHFLRFFRKKRKNIRNFTNIYVKSVVRNFQTTEPVGSPNKFKKRTIKDPLTVRFLDLLSQRLT